ncbi:hypothetical protein Dimus_006143 [Dionaea muscipula]
MPRVSCLNEVRVGDVYLIDILAHRLRGRVAISLTDTLIREMRAMAASTLKAPELPDSIDLPTDDQDPPPLAIVEFGHPQMPDFGPSFQPGWSPLLFGQAPILLFEGGPHSFY